MKETKQFNLHAIAKFLIDNFLDALTKMHHGFIQSTKLKKQQTVIRLPENLDTSTTKIASTDDSMA